MAERSLADMTRRYFAMPPKFDPEKGATVFEPEGSGYGHWVGGHSVCFDPENEKFYLYYRLRSPLGQGRGAKCRIAESNDGEHFADIWEGTKEQLDAESIEVATLIQDPASGRWRLYVSYEVAGGSHWRVDLVEADHPSKLDLQHHRTVITPLDFGLSFAKDPRVYVIGGLYHAFVAVNADNPPRDLPDGTRLVGGGDATALFTSEDGIYWREMRRVFEPGRGAPGEWGLLRARINSIVRIEPLWVAFFDGGESFYDNYEEWCGVAISSDLEHWRRVSRNGPWVRSAHGCIRYMEALRVSDEIFYYYEYTRSDGSHEIRHSRAKL